MYARILEPPAGSFFLLGPRGTGKTTWARKHFPRGKAKSAIEVKASARVNEEHFRGLRAVAGLPGLERRILVYLGERSQRASDGIEIWPFDRFWRELDAGRL